MQIIACFPVVSTGYSEAICCKTTKNDNWRINHNGEAPVNRLLYFSEVQLVIRKNKNNNNILFFSELR